MSIGAVALLRQLEMRGDTSKRLELQTLEHEHISQKRKVREFSSKDSTAQPSDSTCS
jgi:hypothetical protein